jgi:hypothetical protein
MTKKNRLYILPILSVIVASFIFPQYAMAQSNEKAQLLKSSFGDFRQAKKVRKNGKTLLRVWEPQIKYINTLSPNLQRVMFDGVENLNVEYDEEWTWENDEGLTSAEKRKFRGKNDIHKLYWKRNAVQAGIIEKYYVSDPFTGNKLSKPSHKIWNIYNRAFILRKLSKE